MLVLPLHLYSAVDISWYGFIKFDLLCEDRYTGNIGEIFPPNVPLNSDRADHHAQTIFDARSSRIGIKAFETVQDIKITANVDGDFFTLDGDGRNNSRHFRLRMAYLKAQMPIGLYFLVGQ